MATLKTCFKCKRRLSLAEYYKHPAMADGYLGKCKACTRADSTRNRWENIERVREYDRQRDKRRDPNYLKQYRKLYPGRDAAHRAVSYAVRTGRLTPLPCLVCGGRAVAHHPDYSRPLDVVWLCQAHHKQAHEIANKENDK